jgi:hypothetical protein
VGVIVGEELLNDVIYIMLDNNSNNGDILIYSQKLCKYISMPQVEKEMSLIKQLMRMIQEADAVENAGDTAGENNEDDENNESPDSGEIDDGAESGDGTVENDEDDEDNDREGVIRSVPNAQLVYKRNSGTGNFDELWVYNVSKEEMQDELAIRQNILAGTDIPIDDTTSPDNSQTCEIWTAGNVQFMYITGLPN